MTKTTTTRPTRRSEAHQQAVLANRNRSLTYQHRLVNRTNRTRAAARRTAISDGRDW